MKASAYEKPIKNPWKNKKPTKQQKVQTHVPCPAFFWTLSMSLNFLFALFFFDFLRFLQFLAKIIFWKAMRLLAETMPFSLTDCFPYIRDTLSKTQNSSSLQKKCVSLPLSLKMKNATFIEICKAELTTIPFL